ncbi:hypothetical protein FRX31_028768 [Thalictrum thalictroides]|uniref:RING-type domain-containing protein n=1 Tax=Thalictrum thalictroides TaxID=46969 RepID=A0A7J6V9J7_THATH|nr:hypothetical protein FRX31_028768 [Thalictrum thalictroides]
MEENRRANISGTESGSPREHASTRNSQLPRENINFNLGPREQQMIQTHFELLRVESNRALRLQSNRGHGGPIRNRDIRRGYGVAGSARASRASNQYDLMNLSREQYFPSFGLSFNPNGSSATMLPNETLNYGVRAGMSRLARGHYNSIARRGRVPYASQRGMTTFGEFAYEANPWLRYTDRYRETIEESNRNHAAMQALLAIAEYQRNNVPLELRRNNPYNPHNRFPAQNPCNNVATCANSEESGIQPRNNDASQEESEEVGSSDENTDELEVESQNHGVSLDQQIVADDSTTRCMLCLMEMAPNPSHMRRCGHYFHYQCLMVYPSIIECCFCKARDSQGN